jgi:hypothetical protein
MQTVVRVEYVVGYYVWAKPSAKNRLNIEQGHECDEYKERDLELPEPFGGMKFDQRFF